MTCKRQDQLVLYLWDELEPSQMADFKEHLEQCPLCREQIEILAPLVGSMQSVKSQEMPTETAQRIGVRLEQAASSRSSGLRITPLRVLATAASIALVVGLTIWFSNGPNNMSGSSENLAQQTNATVTDDDDLEDLALAIADDLETFDLQLSGHTSALAGELYDLAEQVDSLWQQLESESPQEESLDSPDNGRSRVPADSNGIKTS